MEDHKITQSDRDDHCAGDNKDFIQKLTELKACVEAIDFVRDNKYTLKQAWAKCERADWMLWLMCKMEFATQRERIHIICDCAATSLKYVPKEEDRPHKAIEAARKYADESTEENKEAAWAAAWAATAKAVAWAAAWAAEAAAGATTGVAAWAIAHKKMCKMIRKKIKSR